MPTTLSRLSRNAGSRVCWLEEKNRPTAPTMVNYGVYAPEVGVADDASPHTRLLALTGRSG